MFKLLMVMAIVIILTGLYLKTEDKDSHETYNLDSAYSSVEKLIELDRRVRNLEARSLK